MKTMFTAGFAPQQSLFSIVPMQNPYSMGQSSASYSIMNMTPIERARVLNDVNRAAEEYKAIMAWKNSNGSWQTILGNDLAAFNDNLSRAEEFGGLTLSLQGKLSGPSGPSGWTVNGEEYDAATYWVGFIDAATKLMTAHAGSVKAPGGPTVAAPAPSGPSPLVIGAGAIAAVGLLAILLG